jgi:hypothetical protein
MVSSFPVFRMLFSKAFLYSNLLLLMFCLPLTAQDKPAGRITGLIIDEQLQQPLSNANILLLKLPSKEPADADASDTQGIFTLENVKPGDYCIVVTYIGYNKFIIDSLNFSGLDELSLGTIAMHSMNLEIAAATVTGERQVFEYRNDILNVNVDKLKSSDSETMTELFRKIPFLYVQGNDKIFLNGISAPTILLDGRKSTLTSIELLSQTNVSDIERIEILLSSSAKYEAEGTGGVINIITRNRFIDQVKLNSNVTIGNKDNYRGSFDLYYGSGGFSIYGGYKNNYSFSDGGSDSFTDYFITDILSRSSVSVWNTKGNSNNFRAGADYKINENSYLSGLALYDKRYGGNRVNGYNYFSERIAPGVLREFNDENIILSRKDIVELLLNYTNSSKVTGHNFKVDLFYSDVNMDNNSLFKSVYNYADSLFYDNRDESSSTKFFSVSADYEYAPVRNKNFQLGYKSIFRERESGFQYRYKYSLTDNWLLKDNMSNDFNFDDQIHALYSVYTNNTGSLVYTLGVRGEYVSLTGDQVTSQILFSKNYFDLFPSVKFRYDLGNRNFITLNYNREISRPFLAHYNPFVRQNSTYSFSSGNPEIKPAYTDRISLIKMLEFFDTPFNVSLNYSRNRGLINQPSKLYQNGIYYSIAENNEDSDAFGISTNSFHSITDNLTLSSLIIFSKNYYTTRTYLGQLPEVIKYQNNFYIVRFNIWSKLFWDMSAFLDLSCISGFNTSQSKRNDNYLADFTLKKSFFDNTFDLSLNLSNLIQRDSRFEYRYSDYYSKRITHPADIFVSLSFGYNFNKFQDQKTRKPDEDTGRNE